MKLDHTPMDIYQLKLIQFSLFTGITIFFAARRTESFSVSRISKLAYPNIFQCENYNCGDYWVESVVRGHSQAGPLGDAQRAQFGSRTPRQCSPVVAFVAENMLVQ